MAISILTPHNSCDLTPLICRTEQSWNSISQESPYDNYTAPRTMLNPYPMPGRFGINPRLGAVVLGVPVVFREDSYPKLIIKFHHPSSLDYRAL